MYSRSLDIAGQKFGRLTAVRIAGKQGRAVVWLCRCDCGKDAAVRSDNLRAKVRPVTSCGCAKRGDPKPPRVSLRRKGEMHGMSRTPEYRAWSQAIRRCHVPKSLNFKNYGGRGISVCQEWKASFAAFFAHVGLRPHPSMSIDRINNDGNYEPGNVRWATRTMQNNNTRKTAKRMTPEQRRADCIRIAVEYQARI